MVKVLQSEKLGQMAQNLSSLVNLSALFTRALKHYWFPYVTRALMREDHLFLNFGYEEDPPMDLPLEESDVPNRWWIQLYHCTVGEIDLGRKDVLEVSCGLGGGASYLTRTMRPSSYTGLDFNKPGIDFCQERHNVPNLHFVHGDAENLPFADQSFDVVLNVEASHIYPDFERFLGEVVRVLRPAGHFLYADFRSREAIPAWEASLAASPMRLESQRDINAEVVRALQATSKGLNEMTDRCVPWLLRGLMREHAYLVGSQAHQSLKDGDIVYRMYSFAKE